MAGQNARTGYASSSAKCRLYFNGDESKYELWEVKFSGYLRTLKLHEVITAGAPDADKNAEVFGELVQLLDDTSLSLIIRDAKDKGKEALKILRDHYIGASKPRIISLYTELTSLKMSATEDVTQYIIRAETASASLKSAGETISDSLLIAMILKGLTDEYKTFSTVVTSRKDPYTFQEFKIALKSCEETQKSKVLNKSTDDSVMFAKEEKKSIIRCFECNKLGHKADQCRIKKNKSGFKNKRWCDHCKSHTHDTSFCRHIKKNAVKSVSETNSEQTDDNDHSFAMKVGTISNSVNQYPFEHNNLLVDSGSSTHIVTEKSKFTKFDAKFQKRHAYH